MEVDTCVFLIIKNLYSSNDTIMKMKKTGENIFGKYDQQRICT